MASEQEKRAELDARARKGETVVPGGTRGKSLDAQERLADGIFLFIFCMEFILGCFICDYCIYSVVIMYM